MNYKGCLVALLALASQLVLAQVFNDATTDLADHWSSNLSTYTVTNTGVTWVTKGNIAFHGPGATNPDRDWIKLVVNVNVARLVIDVDTKADPNTAFAGDSFLAVCDSSGGNDGVNYLFGNDDKGANNPDDGSQGLGPNLGSAGQFTNSTSSIFSSLVVINNVTAGTVYTVEVRGSGDTQFGAYDLWVNAVPEPASIVTLLGAVSVLGLRRRRKLQA